MGAKSRCPDDQDILVSMYVQRRGEPRPGRKYGHTETVLTPYRMCPRCARVYPREDITWPPN